MVALVLRIVFRSLVTLFLLTACVFFALHLTGDPARIMLGDGADATALAAFRAQWGLDRPLWEQFLVYLQKFITLDMGRSYLTGLPVKEVFLNAFWPTLDLMIPTAIVTLLFGIPAGVIAALHRNTNLDKAMMFVSVIWLGWLPSYGNATGWHYIMPIITMATSEAAIFSRYARSAMIEAMRLPCVKAAQMRGLPRRRIIWLHALPNAMLSILTIMGFFLGTLVAGAVITENVFSWPGVGKLLVQSVANRDIPVVQLIVLATGASLIIANLAMDLLALVVNPRLRKSNN